MEEQQTGSERPGETGRDAELLNHQLEEKLFILGRQGEMLSWRVGCVENKELHVGVYRGWLCVYCKAESSGNSYYTSSHRPQTRLQVVWQICSVTGDKLPA